MNSGMTDGDDRQALEDEQQQRVAGDGLAAAPGQDVAGGGGDRHGDHDGAEGDQQAVLQPQDDVGVGEHTAEVLQGEPAAGGRGDGGVNARNSTTATGTSATIVMSRMSTKRHHWPRVPFSRGGQLLLVFFGDVTDLGGLVDDGHQIAAFRICR